MKHLISAACLSLALLVPAFPASKAEAETVEKPLVVLELYTSQGCSSCPPADELLRKTARERDDVLALSFHVDYWDYIGWKDTFALPSNGKRQKTYAHLFGERMVYTPQLVLQGQTAMVGHKASKLTEHLDLLHAVTPTVAMEIHPVEGGIQVMLRPLSDDVPPADLHLIRFQPEATVQIGRGENAGRRQTYTNVVRDWHVAWMWDGVGPQSVMLPTPGPLPVAALLQEKGQGEVLAAATFTR